MLTQFRIGILKFLRTYFRRKFVKADISNVSERLEKNILEYLKIIKIGFVCRYTFCNLCIYNNYFKPFWFIFLFRLSFYKEKSTFLIKEFL